MADNLGNTESEISGGSDLWDNDNAGYILSQDFFPITVSGSIYRGGKNRSQVYLGAKSDSSIYLGVKSLFP